MAFPNLIGLAFLGGTVAKLTKEYFSNREKYE
jgi:Na+/alanine symporter